MADTYTGTAAVTVDQAAYDRHMFHGLRRNLYFDAIADVRPTAQSMPGSSVIFNVGTEMSVATATLNESTDVDAVALADSQVTVTLLEKGNAIITTAKLRGTSYVVPYDEAIADYLMYNAALSLDTIACAVLIGGSNVIYATGGATDPTARNTVEATDTIVAYDVRKELARLRGRNVQPYNGGGYAAFIHPDVAFDLRSETGAAAWRDPHTYSQPGEIWTGEIGMFENFKFVEVPAAPLLLADVGSSTTLTDVYITLFLGRQCLAKAWSQIDGNGEYPQFVKGAVTDKLGRNQPLGWYWLGGFSRFREESIDRVESSSSIGTNA